LRARVKASEKSMRKLPQKTSPYRTRGVACADRVNRTPGSTKKRGD